MATKYSRGPRPSSQSCTEVSHCTNSPRQLRRDRHTCTSSTFRRFPRRNPAAISHCRSVSLLTSTACSLAKYSQASVGPKSRYFVFTSFSVRVRRLSGKRRFDTFPRSRCTTPRSPCSSIRTNNLRTSRSLIPKCPAASPCVKCPSCTSCNTFNRSRSFPLSISISWFRIRPVCRSSTGHFYFAEIGHSHFAATFDLAWERGERSWVYNRGVQDNFSTSSVGNMSETHEVTLLLAKWGKGNQQALNELMPLVYRELRQLAASYLRKERHGHTLQPTALVHEAYVRLVDQTNPIWQSRSHFYGVAARLMRQILVDHARRKQAGKRGGLKVSLDEAVSFQPERSRDLVALDSGLNALEKIDPRKCQAVELRYFGGLSMEEIAQALGVSAITVRRDLRMAEAWLHQEMKND